MDTDLQEDLAVDGKIILTFLFRKAVLNLVGRNLIPY
jgi:hypothetical protein